MHGPLRAGSPIRRPRDRRVCAPTPGFSQLAASFVGFPCQGIRRAPCVSYAPLPRGARSLILSNAGGRAGRPPFLYRVSHTAGPRQGASAIVMRCFSHSR